MRKIIFILIILYSYSKENLKAQYFTKVEICPINNNYTDSRSVNWIDVNNDNQLDLFISNGPKIGQNNSMFINFGNGKFKQVFNDSIVLDNKSSDGASFADADNDGMVDAFIVNWYNQNNLFYHNIGNGKFSKINSQIISNDSGYSETASWGDYDNDGLLDLYVTNSIGDKKNYLYHNDGENRFSKVLIGDHVNDSDFSRCVSWVDIDMDGDLDIFITNENEQNETIYRNDEFGVFKKLHSGDLLNDGGNTNSSSWADFDNDGDLDVFLANGNGYNSLFKNEGNFSFIKVLNDTVAHIPSSSVSSAWSDIDNDGDLDLFVTNSFKKGTKLVNLFFMNDGLGNFVRNNSDIICKDSSWYYGCAFGDYDNDGFEDLAVATCRFNGLDQGDLLYHNNGNSNNWITLKLIGNSSNRMAIGAKVKIKSMVNGKPVWQMREVSSQSSYCGQNDFRVHFGLNNGSIIDSLVIQWPLGLAEFYENISCNQFLEFIEGASLLGSNDTLKMYEFSQKIISYNENECYMDLTDIEIRNGDEIEIFTIEGKKLYSSINSIFDNSKKYRIPCFSPGIYSLILFRKKSPYMIKKILIQ